MVMTSAHTWSLLPNSFEVLGPAGGQVGRLFLRLFLFRVITNLLSSGLTPGAVRLLLQLSRWLKNLYFSGYRLLLQYRGTGLRQLGWALEPSPQEWAQRVCLGSLQIVLIISAELTPNVVSPDSTEPSKGSGTLP